MQYRAVTSLCAHAARHIAVVVRANQVPHKNTTWAGEQVLVT